MGRCATILLGLAGIACAFDASGLPTSSNDGTGIASSEGSGNTSTSTSTGATTAVSASDDSAVDSSTSEPLATTDPVTTMHESDASSGTTDPSGGTTTEGSSSGVPDPICGDGMIESPETCETGDLGVFACSDLGDGYGGTPSCAGCQIDDGPCCLGTGVWCVPGINDCCDGCGGDFVCD